MYLEHLNLVVSDIPKAMAFFQAAFPHWRVRSEGEGEWYGVKRRWLHLGDDTQYLTLNDDGDSPGRDLQGHQIGVSHVGFVVSNLDNLLARMQAAGYEKDKGIGKSPFRRNAYFIAPDGFEVEFVEYLSDVPSERNLDD